MSPGEPLKLLILPTISIKTDTTKSRHLDNAAANAKFDFADSFSDAFMIFCSFWSFISEVISDNFIYIHFWVNWIISPLSFQINYVN